MKNNIEKIKSEIKEYCDFNIFFEEKNSSYLFNNKNINHIKFNQFDQAVDGIIKDINALLVKTAEKTVLIDELLNIVNITSKLLYSLDIQNFMSFNKLNPLIVKLIDDGIDKKDIIKIKYNYSYLMNLPEQLNEKYDEIVYFLCSRKSITDNYKDNSDIEKVKLQFTLIKFDYSIKKLEDYLFSTRNYIQKYGYFQPEDINSLSIYKRCTVNFSKIEVAMFFQALFETDILNFPSYDIFELNQKRNNFIDNHFNFVNERNNKTVTPIQEIDKEYSKIASIDYVKEAQVNFRKLISKLEEKVILIKHP
jgi:hypothetical protein